jgi:hypothetical protein
VRQPCFGARGGEPRASRDLNECHECADVALRDGRTGRPDPVRQWQASEQERAAVSNSDEQLLSILVSLEECRTALRQSGRTDTARLVSIAILDVRMKLHHVEDGELKALCEQMMRPDSADDERSHDGRSRRRLPLLRLVK